MVSLPNWRFFKVYLIFYNINNVVIAFKKIPLLLLVILFGKSLSSVAQRSGSDDAPVTFEELYDAPYDINQLFIGFQPMYGETFVTNINGGFGFEATYFHQDLLRIHAGARLTYGRKFDQERNRAENNSTYIVNYYSAEEATLIGSANRKGITNPISPYNYFEIGGTYHIKDFEKDDETKMYLYKKSYEGDKWAARVPRVAPIPCKLRQIYGARLGVMYYNTSTDLRKAMGKQGVSMNELVDEAGTPFLDNHEDVDISLAANMSIFGIYAGASMTWIHNVAVEFDNKYEAGVDDLILNAYIDFIYGASVLLEDITYLDDNPRDPLQTGYISNPATYSLAPVQINPYGFRLGLEGKFNRALSWSYGGEMGYKPSLKGRGFFALIKISIPVYSTNLKYEVEAFGK